MPRLVHDDNPGAHNVVVTCYACGHRTWLSNMVSDLDGPAYLAYYCLPGRCTAHSNCRPKEGPIASNQV